MNRIKQLISSHKLLSIVLAAFLATSLLAGVAGLALFSGEAIDCVVISEENGIYDLRDLENIQSEVIQLTPSTVYYPNTYLNPGEADTTIPESVDAYEAIRAEYLSQRFVIKLPDTSDTYMLTFTLSGRHAMRVFVNGRQTAQTGQPASTKQGTEVWENNITFHATAINGEMDIILNSAHFYHEKRGASLATLSINKSGTGTDPFLSSRLKGIAVMGALLCAAVLLMGMYVMLSHTRATLYFAIACLVMALRECLQSQAWIYFRIHGNFSFMLEYMSMVLLTIFLALYHGQYATSKFLKVVQHSVILGSVIYGIILLFGDSIFYTSILKYYQLLIVICIVLGISVLFWKMRNPMKEQAAAMFGIAFFFLAAVYDILMYSSLFDKAIKTPISEIAMLVFVLAQTVSLFQINNRMLGEAKELEQKLESEKNALEILNRLKTEFLGNVSHELKTPLTVMSGYAQITKQLADKSDVLDGAEVSRRMTLISSEAERLSLMVGQVLDVTRMEEGRMVMEPVSCYIDEIVHTAVETHYPILNKNQNRLEIRIESGIPATYADPARISQVIVNLISNAVRFTSDGVIRITGTIKDDCIRVCVADTGIGISPERLPNIFVRYGKKQKSSGGQDTGTGLGLYICKHIVTQHGGEIWIESKEGEGTQVFFTLPIM